MAAREITEIPGDNIDHNMISDYFANLQERHDYIYLLAEIDSGLLIGAERTGVPELTVLHTKGSLNENERSRKFESRRCYFTVKGRVIEGTLCFATKERSLVDGAIAALRREHELRNQCGIHVLTHTTDEENHQISLNLIPQHQNLKHQHYKMKNEKRTDILHTHTDRSYMEKIMLYIKAKAFDICNNQTLISYPEMKKELWQFVQYSTKPNEVIFRVVQYKDTKWQELNNYKDIVSFIRQGTATYQAVVLFSSMDKNEIMDKFTTIEHFLENENLPNPEEIDARVNEPTAVVFKRSTLFQRAEDRDSDGQRRDVRNNLEEITESMLVESVEILKQFVKLEAIDKALRYHLIEKDLSLDEAGNTPESSINTLTYNTSPSFDIDSSGNDYE